MIDDQEVEAFLEHFGVLGMHWGIRNEKEKQARREGKAQKFETKAALFQTKINELNAKSVSRYSFQGVRIKKQTQDLSEKRKQALEDAQRKREGKLSRNQKRLVVGTSAAAAIIAAYGTYSMAQSGELHRLTEVGKNFLQGKKPGFTKSSLLTKPDMNADAIMSNVVKPINSGFGGFGTKQNCRRCTFAYEMRRRGNDVVATRTSNARGQGVTSLFNATSPGENIARSGRVSQITRYLIDKRRAAKGGKLSPFATAVETTKLVGKNVIADTTNSSPTQIPNKIFDALKTQPNGARGELGLKWRSGGGHSMAWEIIKGQPVIFDAQTGKKYATSPDLFHAVKGSIMEAGFTRLDNVPLNENFLLRWLKDAG